MPNKDPEKRKAYNRAWYAAHKDTMKTYFREYYYFHKRTSMQGRGVRTDLGHDADLMSWQAIARRLGYARASTPQYHYKRAMAKLRKRFTHEEILEALRDLPSQDTGPNIITDPRVRAAVDANLVPGTVSSWELWVSPSSRLTEWEKELLES